MDRHLSRLVIQCVTVIVFSFAGIFAVIDGWAQEEGDLFDFGEDFAEEDIGGGGDGNADALLENEWSLDTLDEDAAVEAVAAEEAEEAQNDEEEDLDFADMDFSLDEPMEAAADEGDQVVEDAEADAEEDAVVAADAWIPEDVEETAPMIVPVVEEADDQLDAEAVEAVAGIEVVEGESLVPFPQELGMNQEVWRQERRILGEQAVHRGNKAFRENDYQAAFDHYSEAKEILPTVSRTSPEIQALIANIDELIRDVYSEWAWSLVREAEKDVDMGKFEEALDKFQEAMKMAPEQKEELGKVYAQLQERRKALEFAAATSVAAVDPGMEERNYEIEILLEQGKILFENQRYLQAQRIFEDVLVKDPFQIEAVRMLRRIGKELQRTAEERRLAVRAERLAESSWSWSQPVRPLMTGEGRQLSDMRVPKGRSDAKIREKLQNIIIPRIEFEEATIHQVVSYLKTKSKELDPENVGVNIVLHLADGASGAKDVGDSAPAAARQNAGGFGAEEGFGGFGEDDGGFGGFGDDAGFGGFDGGFQAQPQAAEQRGGGARTLTLNMDKVPLGEVIKFVCLATGLKRSIEPHAVIISDTEISQEEMITRFFPVGADLFDKGGGGGGGGDDWDLMGGNADADGGDAEGGATDVRTYFANLGVSFPQGATIHYDQRISKLIVRNTDRNIQQIENILEEIDVRRSQVTIEAKFVEVYQNDLSGLGFQWMVQDGLGTGDDPFQIQSQAGDYYFSPNISDDKLTGWDRIWKPFGFEGETYSADATIDDPGFTVDASSSPRKETFLSSGIRTVSQALGTGQSSEVLAVTTILGGMEFDTIINAVSQKSNSDILSAPKVTTTSGNTAIIRMVEERYFPESWTEPEVTTDEGTISITPSSPEFGDSRDIGVLLEVTPTVENDGYTIGLDLRPQVLEFLGYDTEHNVVTSLEGQEVEWKFNMPIISARTVETSVVIYNGETVVLGGMIKEAIQEFEDKVPILGDVPVFGRLFTNKGEKTEKRNLLIFVTARLVDPAGQPLREKDLQGVPDFGH